MSLVALLNSQPEVHTLVARALAADQRRTFVMTTARSSDEALEVLSFDLP